MISGPIIPRTGAGLAFALSEQLDSLEWGLRTHLASVDLDGAGMITLARDAIDRPVVVLMAASDSDGAANAPAAAVHAYTQLADQPWLLQRLFPHRLRSGEGQGLRVMVVGLAPEPVALESFHRLVLPDLTVVRLHGYRLGGRAHWVARVVHAHPARADEGRFTLPSALSGFAAAGAAHEFLSWLERLDDDVVAAGDRYSRRIFVRGRPLCVLAPRGPDLAVWRDSGEVLTLSDRQAAERIADGLMSELASSLHGADAASAERETVEPELTSSSAAPLPHLPARNGVREPVARSLRALRDDVERTSLSAQELRALQDEGGSR